jgi:hypothetical protein
MGRLVQQELVNDDVDDEPEEAETLINQNTGKVAPITWDF